MTRFAHLLLLSATTGFAAVPHRFTAGSTAKADSVNANFEYLDASVRSKADTAALNAVKASIPASVNLSGYATTAALGAKADTSALNAVKASIPGPINLNGYATSASVRDSAAAIRKDIPAAANLAGYATLANLKDSASKIRTSIPSVDGFATTTELTAKADVSTVTALSNRTSAVEASVSKAVVLDANEQISVPGGVQVGNALYGMASWTLAIGTPGGLMQYASTLNSSNGMTITQSVGGSSPTSLLQVRSGYVRCFQDLYVGGKITVTGTGSSIPDYVFEPGYRLAPLSEIEAYTQEHKHLPEVPSAAEIIAGGMDLTAMNLTLLKKVEELTLHAIAQSKQIDAQAAQIQAQNERLRALETIRN